MRVRVVSRTLVAGAALIWLMLPGLVFAKPPANCENAEYNVEVTQGTQQATTRGSGPTCGSVEGTTTATGSRAWQC